uniref:Kelch like family member 34 n=1 Tax=Neogobius melanostomus TaxID=47308 RepID=A0A8C6SH16_9GOBI
QYSNGHQHFLVFFLMDSYSVLYSSAHRTRLLASFQRLRTERKMCDVVLSAGGIDFPCHRALLASSSEYFWALFGETTTEREAASVSLPALTPEGLDAILDFLYSGWLSISKQTLPLVLEAARYLQVDTAVAICDRFMIDSLNAKNCCAYANIAERHALSDALEAANHTIAMEMNVLLQESRDNLLELNFETMMAVLDAGEIPSTKEADLIRLALDWLDENGPLPLLKSNLLLSRLRFGLVAMSDLANYGHKAMNTPLIRSQLTRASEYHGMGIEKPLRQSKQTTVRSSPNRVLLVGGGSNPDWPEQQMMTFDPRTRKLSSLQSELPMRLKHHSICSIGGFLFVIGGEEVTDWLQDGKSSVAMLTSNKVWLYDPRFAQWEQTEPMLERRSQFTCCVVEDIIYAIGGRQTQQHASISLGSVEYFDMTIRSWRKGAPLPNPIFGHATCVLDNNIYLSGGVQGNQAGILGSNSSYSPDHHRETTSMSIARFGHRMANANGYIYALLGMYEPFCDIEKYDPNANTWTRLRPFLNGSFNYGMVAMPSENLLVFGGRRWTEGQEVIVKTVLEYDTKKDHWREMSSSRGD